MDPEPVAFPLKTPCINCGAEAVLVGLYYGGYKYYCSGWCYESFITPEMRPFNEEQRLIYEVMNALDPHWDDIPF